MDAAGSEGLGKRLDPTVIPVAATIEDDVANPSFGQLFSQNGSDRLGLLRPSQLWLAPTGSRGDGDSRPIINCLDAEVPRRPFDGNPWSRA